MTNTKNLYTYFKTGIVLLMVVLTGCAPSTRKSSHDRISLDNRYYNNPIGNRATRIALKQIGTRYRFGGNTPRGFDCSGLVHYSYGQMGIHLPRSARLQSRALRSVPISQLRPGDLVFFKISRNQVSHVGIYYHDGLFVHAPKSGKNVSMASLSNPYWRSRYYRAGRVYDDFRYTAR